MTIIRNHALVGSKVLIDNPLAMEKIGCKTPVKALIVGVRNNFGKFDYKLKVKGKSLYLNGTFFKILGN